MDMPAKTLNRHRMQITLSADARARLEAWAKLRQMTMSACIEEALGAVLPKTVRKERSE